VIGHARIPIIKGVEKSFGFYIDISINAKAGILNVPRIRDLLAACPVMYSLVMFGKRLLFQYRLDDPFRSGIGGITLQYMALFTIQAAPQTAKCISGSFYSRPSRCSARPSTPLPPGSQFAGKVDCSRSSTSSAPLRDSLSVYVLKT
jgi:DNA polymerase sigma